MKEIYHYHITLRNITADELAAAARLVKGKPTTIDLRKDTKKLLDRMITKYQTTSNIEIVKADAEKLKQSGLSISRIKLERVVGEFTHIPKLTYLEAHIKVQETHRSFKGMALSRNPSEQGTRFFNMRIYTEEQLDLFHRNLNKIRKQCTVVSEQLEEIVFDSNWEHDSWWA